MAVRAALGLAFYLLLAAGVWFGLGSINRSFFRRLATDGVASPAVVTATNCGNHNLIRYTFQASDRTVAGQGVSGDAPCHQLRPGDPITVWHLPGDPAVNWPAEPGSRLRNETTAVGLAAGTLPAALVGVFTWGMWVRARRAGHL